MILAIDLGSTRFKAALYDAALREGAAGSAPAPHVFGDGGRVELPAEGVLAAVREAVGSCMAAGGDAAKGRVEAVALTSQAQTFTILDADGGALVPFVSWQDGRAEAARAALESESGLADFGEQSSFGGILAALQVAQLRRLRDERPALLARPNRIVHLPTWLALLWTGENVIDENLAAMSGLYSIPRGAWWPEALAAAGVEAAQLSRVVPVGSVAARTTRPAVVSGIPEGIPLVLAGNDQTAGAYGAAIERDNSLLITLGTAQVAYRVCRQWPAGAPDLVRGPYPGGAYYAMAADTCGGNLINWAETVLAGCGTDEAFFARAAASPPGCRCLAFEADVPAGRGAWTGLGLHHGPEDMARAILEALCRRMGAMVRRLGTDGITGVKVAGGGSVSPLWREMLSETLGMDVVRTGASPQAGAARMAWEAVSQGTPS